MLMCGGLFVILKYLNSVVTFVYTPVNMFIEILVIINTHRNRTLQTCCHILKNTDDHLENSITKNSLTFGHDLMRRKETLSI